WWTERCGIPMMFSEPEEPTEQQEAYVKQYFADAEDALMGEDFADPINGYAAWIEPESFLKNYFVQEITKNIDGNMRKSTFITKKKDERLRMYHVWDFDITLGNSCFLSVDFGADNGPQGWFVQEYSCNSRPDMESYNWYVRLFQDPAFRSLAKSMWIEYKPDFDRIPEYIDYLAVLLDDAQKRNYECWNVLGEYVWPQVEIFQTYDEYVTYLKEFYVARIAWMDSQIMQW
ncbi:MAG: CotH kinase family protein, partial [Bacteroidales bacterium]|nr:CotH kinase family protein [Bacteroidales bacterium]